MSSPESVSTFVSGGELAMLTLAQSSALQDTVVMVQARSAGFQLWVDTLTSVASVVIALALIAIAIPLIPAAWNSRKTYAKVNELINRFRDDVDPVIKHTAAIADNLNYISTSVRVDVQQLNQTIAATNERLMRAAALAEERVNEFNGLLQVVQEEAESLFIHTASAVRGVHVGADTFRRYQTEEAYLEDEMDQMFGEELLEEELLEEEEDEELQIRVTRPNHRTNSDR